MDSQEMQVLIRIEKKLDVLIEALADESDAVPDRSLDGDLFGAPRDTDLPL